VTETEDGALPKIIDFGIAKATEHRLTEASVFTELGQWIGTPEYMSPEQTAVSNQDIDTRTDVYSLGVVLYELLVGEQPLCRSDLREAGFDEMRRRIREKEPPRPSTRARSTVSEREDLARRRQTSAHGLVRALEGDLDWLTMKSLEKDRDRRYSSPLDLASDIERYLRDEPVLAGPPGGLYRARKFIRRHRVGAAAAGFCVVALVAGFTLATVGFIRARASEREAIAQQKAAQQVSNFLEEVFSVMDPGAQSAQTASSREVLKHGAARIADSLHDQPEARARLMATMGRVSTSLGYFDLAEPLLNGALTIQREILPEDSPEIASTLFSMGWMAFWQADYVRSHDSFVRASAILENAPDSYTRLSMSARTAFGFLTMRQGDLDGAKEILNQALETVESAFGPNDPLISDALLFLGDLHIDLGNYEESGPAFERALEIRRASYGVDHQQYAFALMSQSRYLRFAGLLDESENVVRQAIDILERTYGPEHPAVANSLGMLGTTLRVREDYEEAIVAYERAISILARQFGPDHGGLSWIQRGLARTYLRMERLHEALETAEEASRISEIAYGPDNIESARGLSLIAYLEYRFERYQESRILFERSLEIRQKTQGADHPALATTYYNHSCVSALTGDREHALDSLQRSLNAGFSSPIAFDDPDLDSLRGNPRFEEMLTELRRRQPD
jgi:non-specific serine/threonine protein kinase/serine/threonine-protein kinase